MERHGNGLREMTRPHPHYPVDIASEIVCRWKEENLPQERLPANEWLLPFVNTVYQASLLREEGESVQCRVMFVDVREFAANLADARSSRHVMRFDVPLDYTAHNLRKLSAAANYYRAILGVAVISNEDGESLQIWGMILTGTSWINMVNQNSDITPQLPPNLALRTQSPGRIVASAGYERLFELAQGTIVREGFDPFRSLWLADQWISVRSSFLSEVQQAHPESKNLFSDALFKNVSQGVVRRVLRLAQNQGHGGMLIFLSEEAEQLEKSMHWFRFRVRFRDDESTRRYRSLVVQLLTQLTKRAVSKGLETITWQDYQRMRNTDVTEIEEELIEFSHLLANLMSIDGSLVLDRSFRLIGFGAEILGDQHLSHVHRALDLEADRFLVEPADTSGTRHRSAYRLVQGVPDALAIVISQDGDVRVVTNRHGKVFYFPYTL